MEQQDDHYIPSHLDDPHRFFWWELDEAVAFLLPFGLGIMMNWLLTGALFGVLTAYGFAKLKKGRGTYFVRHAGYWYFHGNRPFGGTRTPPSHIREYIG